MSGVEQKDNLLKWISQLPKDSFKRMYHIIKRLPYPESFLLKLVYDKKYWSKVGSLLEPLLVHCKKQQT